MSCGDQAQSASCSLRNHKRGIRNPETLAIRRQKRTDRRRLARRTKRKHKTKPVQQQKQKESKKDENKAKAWKPPQQNPKPKLRLQMKLMLGTKFKIATLNIRGTKKLGVRNEIEKWMKSKDIKILALQETRVNQNTRESRKQYTWFFSGEGGRKEYTGGVAIIVHNSYLQYIEDIEPITDRIMYITLRGTMPTTIITVYMPAADRPY